MTPIRYNILKIHPIFHRREHVLAPMVWNRALWRVTYLCHHFIIKSEVSTFPIFFIFPCGCASEMQFMTCANIRMHYGPDVVYVYYTLHYPLIIAMSTYHWTHKMLVRHILSSVCLRLSQFTQLSFMQFMGLCVFRSPISFVMIARIFVLYLIINIRSEVWTIRHCLGLGDETVVCVVCLAMFLHHDLAHKTDWMFSAYSRQYTYRRRLERINHGSTEIRFIRCREFTHQW